MSDSDTDPLSGLLSQFALGPAWARSTDKPARAPRPDAGKDDRPPRRDDRQPGFRDRDGRDNRSGGGGGARPPYQGGGGNRNFQDRRDGPPQREEIAPAPGVRVTLIPDAEAVHLIGKEVHQVARVYPLYDVAQILLAERARCRALFEVEDSKPAIFLGKLDESLFATREEALRHLWDSDLRATLLDEEIVDVDPPTGNFQSVARCGISGEWLGPPNFHSYQTNLRRLHRERFSNMPFEVYASKVRTERGEEAVNAWLETTKKKTRWRLKGAAEEDPWIDDRAEAERALAAGAFAKAFTETRKAEINAAITAKSLSPSLLVSLRMAGNHARKHPAILIPAVCRALENEHLPVFKRQGKLHTGPARPHALAPDAVLAERPGKMVNWIRENKPAKLAGLWLSVLPEGSTAPPAEYAADLFWLLQQGHILLYTDDTLVVQELREQAPPKEGKKKKGPKPAKPEGESEAAAATAAAATAEDSEASAVTEASAPADLPPAAEIEITELESKNFPAETPEESAPPATEAESAVTSEPTEPTTETDPTTETEPTAEAESPIEPEPAPEPEPESAPAPEAPESEPESMPPTEETPDEKKPEKRDSSEDEKLPEEDFAEPSEQPQKPD